METRLLLTGALVMGGGNFGTLHARVRVAGEEHPFTIAARGNNPCIAFGWGQV